MKGLNLGLHSKGCHFLCVAPAILVPSNEDTMRRHSWEGHNALLHSPCKTTTTSKAERNNHHGGVTSSRLPPFRSAPGQRKDHTHMPRSVPSVIPFNLGLHRQESHAHLPCAAKGDRESQRMIHKSSGWERFLDAWKKDVTIWTMAGRPSRRAEILFLSRAPARTFVTNAPIK